MGIQPARAQPLTVITPVHRWWAWWLRFTWPGAEHVWPVNAFVKRPLKNLRFIHFAHWGLITHVPARGGRRLPTPCIVFHTNFNGDQNAYVDAFSFLIPWRLQALWRGALDFPGPSPMGPFRRFVADRAVPTGHYYCAYPDASVKMILAGLELEDAMDALRRAAATDDDEAFARRWERFLADHGNLL